MSSLLGKAASSAGADEEVEPMVRLLLDCGPLADAIDHTRITALTHATEMQTLGEMITPLEMAAREFQSDLLRNFLDLMITRKLKFDNIPSLLLSALSSSLSLRPGWNLVSLTLSALIKAAAAKIGKPILDLNK
ncbi:hypothetical protein PENARI_c015G09384 [Penicillium arizonense]|uniref:Uncharacterized protein n=1 Tax=Penicillium arizonense TaxID=1835702 RepID=A0A1F5LCR7_PENAI|nr:hypothetical protein PENARI_c015G09384 [Penicillium arizonense]OGE50887.1 hypothetical protein PENARI_c015G09384 [Penicillium arizonense]